MKKTGFYSLVRGHTVQAFSKWRAAAILIALSCAVSQAALDVRLDFHSNGPVTAGNWNEIEWSARHSVTSGLKDYNTGLATTVSTVGSNWGSFSHNETWTPPVDWVETNSAVDGFAGAGASSQTFSGLDSQKQYRVELVSAESGYRFCSFTINGVYADKNFDNTLSGNVSQNWDMKAARTNQDWMIWSSLTPDANGNLVISLTTTGNWGVMNAVRIAEVPEPATMVLLGLGGLLCRKLKRA